MNSAAHHPDVLRQLVITLVAVRVEPAKEVLKKSFCIHRLPGGLILIQHNGLFSAAACPVYRHLGLAGRSPARLRQHLQFKKGSAAGVSGTQMTSLSASGCASD